MRTSFSNQKDDDIFSSALGYNNANPKRLSLNQGSKHTNDDEKNLLESKKYFLEDDDTTFNKKKEPTIKMTTSLYPSSTIKPNTKNDKKSNEIDDLLKWIEEPTESTNTRKQNTLPTKKVEDKDAFGFLDDMLPDDTNIPIINNNRPRRTITTTNEETKNKMSALFDLNNTQSTIQQRTSTISDMKAIPSRPMTSNQQKDDNNNQDSVGEINLAVSRRKRATMGGNANRPFTSPVEIGKVDSVIEETGQIADLNFGATDTFPDKMIIKSREEEDDNNLNNDNEYVNSFMNRRSRLADRKMPRNRQTMMPEIKDNNNNNSNNSLSNIDTPKRSNIQQQQDKEVREFFKDISENNIGDDVSIRNMPLDNKDSFQKGLNGGGINSITNMQTTNPIKNMARHEYLTNKLEEKLNNIGKSTNNNNQGIIDNTNSFEKPNDMLRIEQKGIASSTVPQLLDPTLKNLLKDTEEYYKKFIEELKANQAEEQKKWEEMHKQELEYLKKEKQLLIDNLEISLQRERDRLKELHMLELESHDRMHKYELERQKHLFEEQNESLKKQLEAQIQLNILADHIKNSSNRLASISDRIEFDKGTNDDSKKQELILKEKQLKDYEMKLKYDNELLESEKKRYEKLKHDLEIKENEIMKNLDREKDILKQEYDRLSNLQESIRYNELDKRKELLAEKEALEYSKTQLEKDNLRIKEEYKQKYRDLEVNLELFEQQKKQFIKMITDSEADLKRKHDEVDAMRKRHLVQESEILKKLKSIENKENEIKKAFDELQSRVDIFDIEVGNFEKEKQRINEIAYRTQEENEMINKFKRDFENEKEKVQNMKLELDLYAHGLQNEKLKQQEEKNGVSHMQKILENLRYGYVKEIASQTLNRTYSGNIPLKESIKTIIASPLNDMGSIDSKNNDLQQQRKNYQGIKFPISTSATISHKESYSPRVFPLTSERRSTNSGLMQQQAPQLQQQQQQMLINNEIKKMEPSSSSSLLLQRNFSLENKTKKNFNITGFMEQLKDIEHASHQNQYYINKEKDNLLKIKLDMDNVKARQLRNTISSNVTSPLSSNNHGSHLSTGSYA